MAVRNPGGHRADNFEIVYVLRIDLIERAKSSVGVVARRQCPLPVGNRAHKMNRGELPWNTVSITRFVLAGGITHEKNYTKRREDQWRGSSNHLSSRRV